MARHRKFDVKGKPHVAMRQVGSIICAAKVHENGVWALVQGMWAKDRRRSR